MGRKWTGSYYEGVGHVSQLFDKLWFFPEKSI